MSKYIDWLDTMFFVARKKSDHLSTLHVWHHALMPLFTWTGLKFVANMNVGFIAWINSFVHTVMYTYYALSVLGPSVKRHLWWKKYLTTLQIIQLSAIAVHSGHYAFLECNVLGRAFTVLTLAATGTFIYLFVMFFRKQYMSLKKDTKKKIARACQKLAHID